MEEIQQQFINYNKSARGIKPIYIVVHDTGDPKASAQNEHDYFSGGNRGASADYFVDSISIIQIIDTDNFYSWHCGDGGGQYGISNSNSLGIEMCIEEDGNPTNETVQNTLDLVKFLMNKYDIDLNHVVRHYDASRKICPNSFSANSWARWYDFKNKLLNVQIEGKWIFDSDKNKWWYKHSDGSYTSNGWENINNEWYLFDNDGWMLYNWKKYGDTWYYLNPNSDGTQGEMKTGWIFDNGKWYYCDDTGAMKTGWLKDSGEWYYLDSNGAMQTGWITVDGKNYLLDSHGVMYSNCSAYGYNFNTDGVATKI